MTTSRIGIMGSRRLSVFSLALLIAVAFWMSLLSGSIQPKE
jgi:hypothetical protein